MPASRRDMGMVFQAYSLFPHLTARENVAFGLRLRAHGGRGTAQGRRPAARARAPRPARATATRTSCPAASSSAWRSPGRSRSSRRCCCSTSRSRRWMPRCARRCATRSAAIQTEVGITTVFVTHDQDEALAIADRVAVIFAGRARADRAAGRALRAATDRSGRRLRRPLEPDPRRGQGRHGGRPGRAPAASGGIGHGGPVTVLVRPETVELTPDPAGPDRVVARASWARSRASRCALATARWSWPRSRAPRSASFRQGDAVRVGLKPTPALAVEA